VKPTNQASFSLSVVPVLPPMKPPCCRIDAAVIGPHWVVQAEC
jgi:hypothetical protein